jgi:DHA1 family inner membrane transport protein
VNIGALNLGNAFGTALGCGIIAIEFGCPAVVLAGAATTALGFFATDGN